MIQITEKTDCCGCGACVQRCPKECIALQEDEQGFMYPNIDTDRCINCGLCENVCPVLNHGEPRQPLACYAATHTDEKIRLASSSGGVFTALAEYVINQGGVVFGARFNEKWEVVHDYTETIEGLAAFRGSKYVQSLIGENYHKAEQFLKDGRQVLFTGTPCQITGLKHYLNKDFGNLLSVEIACHGVPSPRLWREYIKGKNPSAINFRDKRSGWKSYSVAIGQKRKWHDCDAFMNCLVANYSLRQSCFDCQAKSGSSGADLLVADLWGISQIAPEIDDDKGTSAIVIWTNNGLNTFEQLKIHSKSISYDKVAEYNPAIIRASRRPSNYEDFWMEVPHSPVRVMKKFTKRYRPSLSTRIKRRLLSFK